VDCKDYTVNWEDSQEMTEAFEGYSNTVYYDTEGVPTIGIGHAFIEGSRLPHYIIREIFYCDYLNAIKDYEKLKLELDTVRRSVIIDMLFNLGLTRFKKFRKTITALRDDDYEEASLEMLDSRWARQVGRRACILHVMMLTGLCYKKALKLI